MRTLSFGWLGQQCKFSPTLAMLSAMAADLAKASAGTENTLGLANKMNAGGADPAFAAIALWHMLSASGAEVKRDEAYEQLMENKVTILEKTEFRLAYIQSVLPSVDMGKKPEDPPRAAGSTKGKASTKLKK